jgi:hypothetical protein
MRNGLLLLGLLLWAIGAGAQVNLTGTVRDSTGKPLPSVSVMLVKRADKKVLAFAISSANGIYRIKYTGEFQKDSLLIEANAAGFTKLSKPVTTADQTLDLSLRHSFGKLPDVTVNNSKQMLKQSGDTLNYTVSSFSEKQDRVIGDVIKKLPGVEVADNGQISYNGKPINNLYIDGDNVLDGKYNIATKAIPNDAVEKIQVLENHQPVKALNGVTKSDVAAMNLVMKDKAKTRLIGTGDAALGTPDVYSFTANAMLFKKQVKFINNTKLNNAGIDLSEELINHFGGDNPQAPSLVSMSNAGNPAFSKKRYLFNNSVMVSLNDLVNLNKDWQLRINAFYLYNKVDQSYRYSSAYFLPTDTIRYDEQQHTRNTGNTFNTQFTLTTNRSAYYFNNVTVLETTPSNGSGDLSATANSDIHQQISGTSTNISNRFNIIKKTSGRSSLEGYSFINHITNPQTLQVQPGLYEAQFNNNNPYAGLKQDAAVPVFYTENYISIGIPKDKFSQRYRIGFNYQQQELNSDLYMQQLNGSTGLVADSFVNRVDWNRLRTYVQADYTYSNKAWLLMLSVPVSFQDLKYTTRLGQHHQSNLPITPRVNLRYNLGRESFVNLVYNYGNTWGGISQVYDGYVMTNYRNFYSNGELLPENTSHLVQGNYWYKNTLRIFFFGAGASYAETRTNTLSDQLINSAAQKATLIPYDNATKSKSAFVSASKYIFPLLTTIGAKLSWQGSNGNYMQNGSLLDVQNNAYIVSANLTTKLTKWMNLTYAGTFSTYQSKTSNAMDHTESTATPAVKKWLNAGDINITMMQNLFGKIVAENYNYHVPGSQDTRITFLDMFVTWKLNKLKTDLELSMTNLTGIEDYTNLSVSANSISTGTYRMRPRMFMCKFLFRF